MRKFIRTCQECGLKIEASDPANLSNKRAILEAGWRNTKCKRCKSIALDYGSWREFDENGDEIFPDDED